VSSKRIEKGQTTRQALIAVATRLFAERGYEATSIDAVLQEAGVSRGAVYHHFSGKEALFEAVLEALETRVQEEVMRAAATIEDPAEALRVGAAAWLHMSVDPVIRRVVLIDAPTAVGWHKWREIDERHAFGLLKTALHAAMAERRQEPAVVDALAHALLAALIEVALVIARAESPETAMAAGETAISELIGKLLA
jgi:AcrR family transcriptional regulator